MSLVNTETSNKAADFNRDIAALERELKEIMAIGYNSPRTANRLDAMEGVILRMKNSVKHVDEFCLHISMCFFRAKEVDKEITGFTATVIKDGGNYVDLVKGYIQQIDLLKNSHEHAKNDLLAALLKFCGLDLDQTLLELDQELLKFIRERKNRNESEIESVMRSIEHFEKAEMEVRRRINDLYANFLGFFPKEYAPRDQEMNRENIGTHPFFFFSLSFSHFMFNNRLFKRFNAKIKWFFLKYIEKLESDYFLCFLDSS